MGAATPDLIIYYSTGMSRSQAMSQLVRLQHDGRVVDRGMADFTEQSTKKTFNFLKRKFGSKGEEIAREMIPKGVKCNFFSLGVPPDPLPSTLCALTLLCALSTPLHVRSKAHRCTK